MTVLKTDLGNISENIDPSAHMTNSSWHILNNISLTLFELNGEQSLDGLLAESWLKENSGQKYIVHLRQDAYFHNGRNITADDVIFSLQRKQKFSPNYELFYWIDPKNSESLKKISKYSLEFNLKKPHDFFLFILALPGTGIVPQEQYDIGSPFQKTKLPILGGAYRVTEWKKNDFIQLEFFEKWFHALNKAPKKIIIYYKNYEEYRDRFLQGKTNYMIDVRNSLANDRDESFPKKYNQFNPEKNNIVLAYLNTVSGPFRDKNLRKIFAAVIRQYFIDQKNTDFSIASEFYPKSFADFTKSKNLPTISDVELEIEQLKKSPVVLNYVDVPRSNSDVQEKMIHYLKNYGFHVKVLPFESHAKNKENRIKGKGFDFGFWMIPLTPGDPCLVYRLDFGIDDFYVPDGNNNNLYKLIASTADASQSEDRFRKAKEINEYFHSEFFIIPLYHTSQNIYSSHDFDLHHLPKWQFNIRFYHVQLADLF